MDEDKLEEFRKRMRKLMESTRKAGKEFNPQELLDRLLSAPEIMRRQVTTGQFPTGIAREYPGVPTRIKEGGLGKFLGVPPSLPETVAPVKATRIKESELEESFKTKPKKRKKSWWEW